MDPQASTSAAAVAVAEAPAAPRHDDRFIAEGDLVILFLSRDRPPVPLCATHGATYANNFGTFPHSSIIGRPYGSTLHSAPPSRGFVTLLRPTPELWTLALPHRTQILYGPDMSFISAKLALGPGATIVEAGTGSGSFTHFLARCVDGDETGSATALGRGWKGQLGQGVSAAKGSRVQTRPPKSADDEEANTAGSSRQSSPPFKATPTPGDEMVDRIAQAQAAAAPTPDDETGDAVTPSQQRGRVWTFEFHAQRAQRAREELTAHGLCPRIVSLSHRNVCQAGFPSSLNGRADAAFLDLPAPWEAIPFLTAVLDPSATTRVACFSPCIEQVLRTVKALNACGFREVETYECLVRTHESTLVPPNGGENKDIEEVKARLREVAKRRKKASEAQRRRAAAKRAKDAGQDQAAEDAQDGGDDEEEEGGEDEAGEAGDAEQGDSRAAKRQRQADNDDEGKAAAAAVPGSNVKVTMSGHGVPLVRTNVHSRVHPVMRGHTSYLTFALLLPRSTATTATAGE